MKFSAPSPKFLYSREANEGKRQGRCPGEDCPLPTSGDCFPGGRKKGGIALESGLSLNSQRSGSPHPRHRHPRIRPHTPREEGAGPWRKERVWKGPARSHSTFLSAPRGPMLTTGWKRGDSVGTGSRWLRRPWARRRPAPRLLPPLAELRSPAPQVTCGRVASPAARSALRPLPPALEAGAAAPAAAGSGAAAARARWGPQPSRRPRSPASSCPAAARPGACRRPPYQEGEEPEHAIG